MKKMLLNVMTLCLLGVIVCACGSKGNAKDAEVQRYKVWNYGNVEGAYVASLHSTNYYSTNKDENLYLNITLRGNEYGVIGGFDWYVYGTPQNEAGTVMRFLPNVDNAIITFDNGGGEIWRGTPSQSGLTFQIGRISDFIERLKVSNTCTIMIESEMGQMTFNFNTNGLKWN